MKVFYKLSEMEAGCDEAGRGALAGPVYGAAVILPPNFSDNLINDSKKLNLKERLKARNIIMHYSVAWAVYAIDNQLIDKINILKASFLSMEKSIEQLKTKPHFLIIDGNKFKTSLNIPFQCIVKGDAKFYSIAAASILAKTFRDDFMEQIHQEYYLYGWNKNKGYPTNEHKKAILEHGLTPFHRKSFHIKSQLKLF